MCRVQTRSEVRWFGKKPHCHFTWTLCSTKEGQRPGSDNAAKNSPTPQITAHTNASVLLGSNLPPLLWIEKISLQLQSSGKQPDWRLRLNNWSLFQHLCPDAVSTTCSARFEFVCCFLIMFLDLGNHGSSDFFLLLIQGLSGFFFCFFYLFLFMIKKLKFWPVQMSPFQGLLDLDQWIPQLFQLF